MSINTDTQNEVPAQPITFEDLGKAVEAPQGERAPRLHGIEGRSVVEIDEARKARQGDGSRDHPFREKSAETMGHVFAEFNVELRWNIRGRRIEFKDRPVFGGGWSHATDRSMADLRERIASQYWHKARTSPEAIPLRFSEQGWKNCLNALAFHHEVDPFLLWLDEEVPPWDGERRLEFLLSDLFDANTDDLSRWAGRAPFVGAVQRARHPGSKIDESPVLISEEQGYGKTSFVRSMVPPEFADEWTGDALDLSASTKEQAEALAGRVIVEIAELAGLRKADIEKVKTFLTRTNDGQHRGAYAHNSELAPRMCVFVGTTNDPTPLANDESGNRRLVPIVLTRGTNVEAAADELRLQWWAEAKHLQASGDDGRLPRHLHPQQRVRAEEHRSRDEHLEDLVETLPRDRAMTIAEIHAIIDEKMRVIPSDQRIGAALRVSGWTLKQTRSEGGRKRREWSPPLATQ